MQAASPERAPAGPLAGAGDDTEFIVHMDDIVPSWISCAESFPARLSVQLRLSGRDESADMEGAWDVPSPRKEAEHCCSVFYVCIQPAKERDGQRG